MGFGQRRWEEMGDRRILRGRVWLSGGVLLILRWFSGALLVGEASGQCDELSSIYLSVKNYQIYSYAEI